MVSRHSCKHAALALALALPGAALAQDADGDGAPNSADAFPCDASRAAVSFYPSETGLALLAFEDQWPDHTDLDFNDVVVRANYRLEHVASGRVSRVLLTVEPVALGGGYSNGLGLQLPLDRAGVTVRRRIAGGAWQDVALQSDAQATVIASSNLRELFANTAGPINSDSTAARLTGQRLEVEVRFATPVVFSTAAAPYDLFIFHSDDVGHQIHFPEYDGTASMNQTLFGRGEDGSTATRKFVHTTGVPAALRLMTAAYYPREGLEISDLFPDIVTFAASGGAQATNFYATNVATQYGYSAGTQTLTAEGAADTSCISPVIGTGLLMNLDAGNPQSASAGSTSWLDLSGNGRHGTLTNGAVFSSARGGSISLDGIDDYVNVPNGFTSMYRNSSAWTTSIWVTVRRFNGGNDAYPVLVSVDSSGGSNYYELFLETGASTTWMAAGTALISQNVTTNVETTYNFVFVLSGTTGYIYRNGALILTSGGMHAMSNVTGNLWLGRFKTGDYELDGQLHAVQVYGRALTQSEITQNFNALRGRFGL